MLYDYTMLDIPQKCLKGHYTFAYNFYQDIKPIYENDKDKLMFILDEKVGHKVSRSGVLETVS